MEPVGAGRDQHRGMAVLARGLDGTVRWGTVVEGCLRWCGGGGRANPVLRVVATEIGLPLAGLLLHRSAARRGAR